MYLQESGNAEHLRPLVGSTERNLSGVLWMDFGVEILSSALQKAPADTPRLQAITGLHGEQPADVDQAPVEVVSQSVLVNSKGRHPVVNAGLAVAISHLILTRNGSRHKTDFESWELGNKPDTLVDGWRQNNKSTGAKIKTVLVSSQPSSPLRR